MMNKGYQKESNKSRNQSRRRPQEYFRIYDRNNGMNM
jgi:hypothetical protein